MKTIEVAMIGICAALYAVIGRLTDFGMVTPTAGVVAFWPAAVIPAVFAVLYGPWTGGTGAAIGIFIRDMLYHGNALVSLSAGVTSNFAMFFLIGYITRKNLGWKKVEVGTPFVIVATFFSLILFSFATFKGGLFSGPVFSANVSMLSNGVLNSLSIVGFLVILVWVGLHLQTRGKANYLFGGLAALLIIGLSFAVPLLFFPSGTGITGLTPFDSMLLFAGFSSGSILIIAALSYVQPEWRRYGIGSVIGLGVGSTIIGFALYFYSQFMPLPGGLANAPPYFILVWIIWTFATEIPFLIVIGPPILKAVYRAFPSLKPNIEESK